MTVSFKVSDKLKEKLIDYFKDKRRSKTPPYAIFQADEADTVVTLYESGKVVFQGVSADIDANYWKETEKILTGNIIEDDKKKEKKDDDDKNDYYFINSVGSDEVGTGDYFGPIVVCASYVNKENISFLEDLGVRDSKKLNDDKILKIGKILIDKIPHYSYILSNKEYNDYQEKGYNMNKIKSILHNRCILNLLKKDNFMIDKVIIDQFTPKYNYFNYLKDINENIYRNITFTVRAEDKCLSVACSSIISRYLFLKEIDRMSKELGINLVLGASNKVDEVGKSIVSKYGKDILYKYAKLNFKNTEKILN